MMSETLLDNNTPRAQREHQCSCCLSTIDRGTQYVRQVIVDGRDIQTLKMHPECYGLLMDYGSYYALDDDDPMPDWGEVLQWQRELDVHESEQI